MWVCVLAEGGGVHSNNGEGMPAKSVCLQEWRLYTKTPDIHIKSIPGNHLWPVSDPAAKTAWLEDVAAALQVALR